MDLTKSKMPCHTRFNMTNKTQKLKVEMTGFEPASSLHPKCSGVPDSPTSRIIDSLFLNHNLMLSKYYELLLPLRPVKSSQFVDLEGVEPSSKQVSNMNFIQLFGSKSDYRCS